MRRGLFLGAFVVLAGAATFLMVRGWAGPADADVKNVPAGDQEIAWISPATSGDAWERLVAALKQLQKDWQTLDGVALHLDFDKAFLQLTADVPEIALSLGRDRGPRLWFRWYKLSGENHAGRWIDKLRARVTPPLAIIGGETSDRALAFSQALREAKGKWRGADPLFLITTATADRYFPGDPQVHHQDWPLLMDVYRGRSFRFAFTNRRMVEAVLDFVRQHSESWASNHSEPGFLASIVAAGNPWTCLAMLHAGGHFQGKFLYTLSWEDDGYSKDLAEIFQDIFSVQHASASGEPFTNLWNDFVQYSVGDYYQPNPREEIAVGLFLANNARFRDQHQLLALPTGAQRARRFLRTLCRRAPMEVRNIIAVTGDAITFNNIYRDRDVAWNIQDMPVPLIFFSHRNPIDPKAGFGALQDGMTSTTGTQDLLLHRDIVEALVLAAFDGGRLLASADDVLGRLRETRWLKGRIRNALMHHDESLTPFFDEAGNRRAFTGEHVIWLRPMFEGNRNLAEATITVWRAQRGPVPGWRLFGEPLPVHYDQPRREAVVPQGD